MKHRWLFLFMVLCLTIVLHPVVVSGAGDLMILDIEKEEELVLVTLDGSIPDGSMVIVGSYANDGRQLQNVVGAASDNIVAVSIDTNGAAQLQAFLVNAQYQPMCSSEKKSFVSLSMDFPQLKASYPVNLPETKDNRSEYYWGIVFTDGKHTFELATSHWKFPGSEPSEMTPSQMQTDLWLQEDGNGASVIGNAVLQIDGTRMTWECTIPAEYEFDLDNMTVTEKRVYILDRYYDIP